MKKIALALTALAALTGTASAADLAARPYTKAPVAVAVAPSWTGCYIGGGGGYGIWNQENQGNFDATLARTGAFGNRVVTTENVTAGGRGYFGTVQGGCDYQFALGTWNMVIGAFADGDWGSQKGTLNLPVSTLIGDEKLSSAWAVGGRLGWLVTPSLLTYFTAGYTEAKYDQVNFHNNLALPTVSYLNSKTYKGYFIGAGDEYALSFMPGLFWKTEYRFSQFDRSDNLLINAATNLPTGDIYSSKKWDQTVRSELVYRFNWTGPVVAKY